MFDTLNRLSVKWRNRSLGLLLIRIGAGIVFFMHGWSKVHNLSGAEAMFMHFGLGGPTGIFIAYLELIGGLCLILGIFTRMFAVAFGIEMLVAIFIMGVPTNYQPHELELFLMLVSFGIALAGSGKYSVFPLECQHCGAMYCKDPNCPGCKVK